MKWAAHRRRDLRPPCGDLTVVPPLIRRSVRARRRRPMIQTPARPATGALDAALYLLERPVAERTQPSAALAALRTLEESHPSSMDLLGRGAVRPQRPLRPAPPPRSTGDPLARVSVRTAPFPAPSWRATGERAWSGPRQRHAPHRCRRRRLSRLRLGRVPVGGSPGESLSDPPGASPPADRAVARGSNARRSRRSGAPTSFTPEATARWLERQSMTPAQFEQLATGRTGGDTATRARHRRPDLALLRISPDGFSPPPASPG